MRNRLLFPALLALIACAATPAPAPAAPAQPPVIRNMDSRAAPVLADIVGPPATARDASVVRGFLNIEMENRHRGEIIQGLELERRQLDAQHLTWNEGNWNDTRTLRHEHDSYAEVSRVARHRSRSGAGRRAGVAHANTAERLTLT